MRIIDNDCDNFMSLEYFVRLKLFHFKYIHLSVLYKSNKPNNFESSTKV